VAVVIIAITGFIVLGRGEPEPPISEASAELARGLELHQAGQIPEAQRSYQRVLELEPRNKFAFFNLGVIEQFAGRPQSAESYYRLAIAVDPIFTSALFNLAIIRNQAGAKTEAIELYQRVVLVDQNNAAAHFNLGLVLWETQGQEAAEPSIRRALEIEPTLAVRLP
jgi:tetratricopeptide (TPR) repeat protein